MTSPVNLPLSDPRPAQQTAIGFLWHNSSKYGQRCVLRQATGSARFQSHIFTRRSSSVLQGQNVPLTFLEARPNLLRKGILKYLRRAHSSIYNEVWKPLPEAAERHALALLHIFHGHKAIEYLPAFARLRIPVTVSFHGQDLADCRNESFYAARLPELFAQAACIMARSEYMADKLEAMGCPADKLWLNRTGIPLESFPFLERVRKRHEPMRYIQVCRLVAKKGLATSVRAFAKVRRRLPNAELWIAGDGELRKHIERLIDKLNLRSSVRLLGFLHETDLIKALHQAQSLLQPSMTTPEGDQEGIPNAMLEAMATGLVPITTQHAGIPEVVENNVNGFLIEEGSITQLAERMLWCAQNPEPLLPMSHAARRAVEEKHDLKTRLRLLDEKYEELIQRTGPARSET